jgi:predicted transcriptional regulator
MVVTKNKTSKNPKKFKTHITKPTSKSTPKIQVANKEKQNTQQKKIQGLVKELSKIEKQLEDARKVKEDSKAEKTRLEERIRNPKSEEDAVVASVELVKLNKRLQQYNIEMIDAEVVEERLR